MLSICYSELSIVLMVFSDVFCDTDGIWQFRNSIIKVKLSNGRMKHYFVGSPEMCMSICIHVFMYG